MDLSAAITPKTIVETQKKLSIPIYQRLFVWGNEQIDNLLNDLWNSQQTNKHYYLGVITVHENDNSQWEIVDGQQRLTFLTLLASVLMKQNLDENNNWNKFLLPDNALRLFFHGRSEDRHDIAKYLSGEQTVFTNRSFVRFVERFDFFANGKNIEDLKKFSEYCFVHIAFLVNELPNAYGAEELNLYFEKMNSTGRQLSPIEVVKGKWFSQYADRWNACMNFDEIFKKQTNKGNSYETIKDKKTLSLSDVIEESLEQNNNSQVNNNNIIKNHLVMRDDILALHVLKLIAQKNNLQFNVSLDRSKLITTFNNFFINYDFNKEEFIEEFEKYRIWLDQNIIFLKDNDGEYEYAFRSDPSETDNILNNDFASQLFRQFQSMLFVSSSDAQEWVLKAYITKMNNTDLTLTYDDLRKIDASLHSDNSLNEDYMRYPYISRYYFWKLDYLLWEIYKYKQEKDDAIPLWLQIDLDNNLLQKIKNYDKQKKIINYTFKPNRSIEHLHPQSKGDSNWGTRDQADANMHRFGNLALISTPSNSAQSDDGIGTKFGRVRDWLNSNKNLESIKMLIMFSLCDGDESKWTTEIASEHAEKMIEILKNDLMYWNEDINQ